jgi:hypothetical protein
METELALGRTAGQGVNARQLLGEDLAEARCELDLEPGPVLEDRFSPTTPRILGRAMLELQQMLMITLAALRTALLLASPKPSTSSIRFSRSSVSNCR